MCLQKHTVVFLKTSNVFQKTSDVFSKTSNVFFKITVCLNTPLLTKNKVLRMSLKSNSAPCIYETLVFYIYSFPFPNSSWNHNQRFATFLAPLMN